MSHSGGMLKRAAAAWFTSWMRQLSSRASQNGKRLSQSEKDLSTCKDCSQHGDREMVAQTVTKTDAQTGLQGTARGRETPRDAGSSLPPYSRQIRRYRDRVPGPDSGRDCGVLGIFDCPKGALRIDTCTLSPLLRDANDCSGTFSSTVSPPCMCSLTVCF